jgi:hypothetical protein
MADASSVSRRADIVRPVCSREVVTKRRYTKANNQTFTSEKFAKAFSVDFGRRGAAFYFWEGTSATRWEGVAPIERVIEGLLLRLPAVIASWRLPAVSAISAVATTITTASTTATVSAPAAAATPVATASAAVTATPAAASTTTATTTLGLRSRFVDYQVASAKILTVQRVDRAIGIVIIAQFNECKSTRLARETIPNQIDTRGSYTDLREILVKLIFRRGKRKIPDIELLHLPAPSARNPVASRGARRRRERRTRAVRVAEPPRARDRRFSGQGNRLEN